MEKEEEKNPHMCESIGHRLLRGRCPKTGNKKSDQKHKCESREDRETTEENQQILTYNQTRVEMSKEKNRYSISI